MTTFNNQLLTSVQFHPQIINWIQRVKQNGGVTPNYTNVRAANAFYIGLVNNNLLSLMKSCCIYSPESLITAITPLINTPGVANDPWTNGGFVASDLGINGLVGNGAKYLNTGFIATSFNSDGSAGLTVYNMTSQDPTGGDMGTWASSGNQCAAYISYSGTGFFDCWNSGGGRISGYNGSHTGYISFNRTSTSASAIYIAKSSVAHSALVSVTGQTAIGNRAATPILWMFGQNPQNKSARTFSFNAIHSGLTAAQSAIFYNLIQTLRKQMGGGYV